MKSISFRINQIAEKEAISIRKLEQRIGCSNGVLSRAILKNTDISSIWVSKIIEEYPGYNSEWLLTGKGGMFRPALADSHTFNEPTVVYPPTTDPNGIPLIGLEVAAGFGSANFAIKEEDIQNRYIVPDFNGIDFMIRVKGSSMYPKYSSGDIIACRILRESKFIQWNKCYVIATNEQGLLVKRLKKGSDDNSLLAVSDNKEYEPFEIPTAEITGIALVIGVIRME